MNAETPEYTVRASNPAWPILVAICDRRAAIVERICGKPSPAPHGFYQHDAFRASLEEVVARKRLAKRVYRHLIGKALRRGTLKLDGLELVA